MRQAEVLIVNSGDWVGLYVDGRMRVQGDRQRVSIRDVLCVLGINFTSKSIKGGGDHLPMRACDLPEGTE